MTSLSVLGLFTILCVITVLNGFPMASDSTHLLSKPSLEAKIVSEPSNVSDPELPNSLVKKHHDDDTEMRPSSIFPDAFIPT